MKMNILKQIASGVVMSAVVAALFADAAFLTYGEVKGSGSFFLIVR